VSQLFEAEALAVLIRAGSHATATANSLVEGCNALEATDRDDLRRQLGKVTELHRLLAARVAGVLRALGGGP
jgi:hypothetical protein